MIGARHRFWESGAGTSAAFQIATKLPSGEEREGLGTGELDFFGSGIFTHQFAESTAVTAYYELGLLGDPDGPGTDLQHGVAIAASHPLSSRLAAFAEVAGVFASEGPTPVFITLGLATSFTPSFAFDMGLAVGLNDDAPDLQFLVGMTVNLGRVTQ